MRTDATRLLAGASPLMRENTRAAVHVAILSTKKYQGRHRWYKRKIITLNRAKALSSEDFCNHALIVKTRANETVHHPPRLFEEHGDQPSSSSTHNRACRPAIGSPSIAGSVVSASYKFAGKIISVNRGISPEFLCTTLARVGNVVYVSSTSFIDLHQANEHVF